MLGSDQRTQAKLARSASTWKDNKRFVMWEALLFLGSFLCGMCFPFLFINKERVETLQSSSEHSKLWRSGLFGSQFLKYSNVCLSLFLRSLSHWTHSPWSCVSCSVLKAESSATYREPWSMPCRDSEAWKTVGDENFPGRHRCQESICQGAQRSIVTQRPHLEACREEAQSETVNAIVMKYQWSALFPQLWSHGS